MAKSRLVVKGVAVRMIDTTSRLVMEQMPNMHISKLGTMQDNSVK